MILCIEVLKSTRHKNLHGSWKCTRCLSNVGRSFLWMHYKRNITSGIAHFVWSLFWFLKCQTSQFMLQFLSKVNCLERYLQNCISRLSLWQCSISKITSFVDKRSENNNGGQFLLSSLKLAFSKGFGSLRLLLS